MSQHAYTGRPRKRLFVVLIMASYILMAFIAWAVWRVSYLGVLEISSYLPAILGVIFTVLIFLTGFGILSMIGAAMGLPVLHVFQRQTYALINLLFPVAVAIGKIFGIKRRRIEGSFIAVSNRIIQNHGIKVPADRLLMVTPHCLQLATCPHKITRDPYNCHRCRGCNVGDLVALAEETGCHFFVVTGGTLARQTVKKIRPQAVLAIACERDLASGIQDVYPIPAAGVLNMRPNGPCYNTRVDMELVRKTVKEMIIPGTEKPRQPRFMNGKPVPRKDHDDKEE